MTKSKIFFWFLAAFIAGVSVASFLPPRAWLVWAVFVFGVALATFALLRLDERRSVLVVGGAIALVAFGMFWFWRADDRRLLPILRDKRLTLVGIVAEEPAETAKSQRVIFRDQTSGEKILIVTRRFPQYRYGDLLEVSGMVEPPENFSPDFDYAAYLAKDDIFSTMSFPEIVMQGRGEGGPLRGILFQVRTAFIQNLRRHLPEPHASFLSGLLVGERRSLPEELAEQLRVTGTTHLVALSGYNITIVADALLKSLLFVSLPMSFAFVAAVVGIILFVILTGAQASAVRAAIMGILVLIARREGRQYRMRNALALAAAVMLLVNPKILRFDTGFQLSFLATLGLVYGSPMVEYYYGRVKGYFGLILRDAKIVKVSRDPHHPSRRRSPLRDILIPTLAAQLFVLPLVVYEFGKLSVVSPLANLAVLPAIPATMFFGFLGGGLAFLAEWLGWISSLASAVLLHYELAAIGFFARLPLAAVSVRGIGLGIFFVAYAVFGFLLWKNYRHAKP